MSFESVQNLSIAMQQEMQGVLMEGLGLTAEKLDRLEALARGAREFLKAASPKELVVPALSPEAAKIQAERFKALGFSPEMVDFSRRVTQAEHARATDGLIRAAQTFGVGEDPNDEDEQDEVEEYAVSNAIPLGTEITLPIGFIDKVIYVLGGSDGDVADHLVDIVNDCRAKYGDVQPDALVPVQIGLCHLIAVGLAAPEIREHYPKSIELLKELESFVLQAAASATIAPTVVPLTGQPAQPAPEA